MSRNIQREKLLNLQFATHLLSTVKGYAEEDITESLDVIGMFIRRAELEPSKLEKCYNMILLELKAFDVGCLRCAYRDFKYKGEE